MAADIEQMRAFTKLGEQLKVFTPFRKARLEHRCRGLTTNAEIDLMLTVSQICRPR